MDDEAIKRIVEILDGWHGPLSWQGLIDQVQIRLYSKYTRQALHRHERIRLAFNATKVRLSGPAAKDREAKSFVRVPASRISRLEAENQRLQQENDRLLEQFVRWAYNAHTRGVSEAFLNQALPFVDRGATKKSR